MKIIGNEMYHIYNQGNNKETIFYCDEDYIKFLKIVRNLVYPNCNILAYCLMPNHFHFLIDSTETSAKIKRIGNIDSSTLSNSFRLLQSRYAQYFNKKYARSGSLFRQKAKAKPTADGSGEYHFIIFQYIHQNPIFAGLVTKMEDWPYSSFMDYSGKRNGTLCNRVLAEELLGFSKNDFVKESYKMITDKQINKFFDERE